VDEADGHSFWSIRAHTGAINAVAFFPDGRSLHSCGADMDTKTWDAARGKEKKNKSSSTDPTCAVAFSPDGVMGATGCHNGAVFTFAVKPGGAPATATNTVPDLAAITFLGVNKIAGASSSGKAFVWECKAGAQPQICDVGARDLCAVATRSDGSLVAAAKDGSAFFWATTTSLTAAKQLALCPPEVRFSTTVLSADGRYLAAASVEGPIAIFNIG
jgi:WD40 repeat protein